MRARASYPAARAPMSEVHEYDVVHAVNRRRVTNRHPSERVISGKAQISELWKLAISRTTTRRWTGEMEAKSSTPFHGATVDDCQELGTVTGENLSFY